MIIPTEPQIKGRNLMPTNQPTQSAIDNFGSIKKLSVPPGWQPKVTKGVDAGSGSEKGFFPSDNTDVCLSLFSRGTPVSPEQALGFNRLLVSKIMGTELTETEFGKLAHVLGYTTVGDNQYTNEGKKGTHEFPAFDIKSAQVVELNDRRVLQVSGMFQDNDGKLKSEYIGYFIYNPDNPTEIDEIVFESKKANGLASFMAPFKEALKTIQWK